MSKQSIVIIGAGFAGVHAGLGAAAERERLGARQHLEITVVAPNDSLLIRPRLYEADIAGARVPLALILDPVGVRHLRADVVGIDTSERSLSLGGGETLAYDQLVLCAGSHRAQPLEGPRDHGVDSWEEAEAFGAALERLWAESEAVPRVAVIGAGFTGLEAAGELASDGVAVTLVDAAPHIAPDFGPRARREIEQALAGLGVAWATGQPATALADGGVCLADGRTIAADLNLWTTTLHASPLPARLGLPLDELGRLLVDGTLAAAGGPLWAAGDGARVLMDEEHVAPMSCQCAMPQGTVAGTNAARVALGEAPLQYRQFRYTTCLDLGAAGALLTGGFERDRILATGGEAKPFKQFINRSLIYPPVEGGAAALLAAGTVDQPSRIEAALQLRALRSPRVRRSLTGPAPDRAALHAQAATMEASHA